MSKPTPQPQPQPVPQPVPRSPWPTIPPVSNPRQPTYTPAVDVCGIYRRAVEILDRDGWCQGTEQDHVGRHCAQGALRIAAGWTAKECADMATENAVLLPLQRHLSSLVTVWNDAPGRTEAEVRAALAAVAEVSAMTGPAIYQELGMWGSDR